MVFLKDYRRADVDGKEKESEIYALLESNRVSNITPFGKGNNVRNHMTLMHTLRNEKWVCWLRDMVLLRQYRMSLNVIAWHLTSFNSSRDFMSVIADAMEGKVSFVDFICVTNSSLVQCINMPTSMLMFFIVTSVWVTS